MASLIPAIGVCVSRMTGGEKRLAYRLEQKLEDDWLLWYDVPLGPRNVHPDFVATHLNKTDTPLSDMAVIYCDYGIGKPVLATPTKSGIPVTYQDDITFGEQEDTVKFLTMHSCKGLEFPLIAIPGAGRAVDEGRKDEEVRLLYVAMTRATRELVVSSEKN